MCTCHGTVLHKRCLCMYTTIVMLATHTHTQTTRHTPLAARRMIYMTHCKPYTTRYTRRTADPNDCKLQSEYKPL